MWGDKALVVLKWTKHRKTAVLKFCHTVVSYTILPPQQAYGVAETKLTSSCQGLTSGRCPPQNHRSMCELCRLLHLPLPGQSDNSSSGSTTEFHTQDIKLGLCSYHHLIWGTSRGQKKHKSFSKKEWLKSWSWQNCLGNKLCDIR